MSGRPKAQLVLSDAAREQLMALTLRRKTAQVLALRARIVLACAESQDNNVVAERLRVTPQTVSKWRGRFVRDRLDGLLDAPRPGAPRTIADAQVDTVIAKTLGSVPADGSHWSTCSMAREQGLSQTAVTRIWRAVGLQPIARRLSSSPVIRCSWRRYVTQVGLYLDPPLKAMVLCVDDKSTTSWICTNSAGSSLGGGASMPRAMPRTRATNWPSGSRNSEDNAQASAVATATAKAADPHTQPREVASTCGNGARTSVTEPKPGYGAWPWLAAHAVT